jgi:hypothetical protein
MSHNVSKKVSHAIERLQKRLKRLKRLKLGPALDVADVWVEDAIAAKGGAIHAVELESPNRKS